MINGIAGALFGGVGECPGNAPAEAFRQKEGAMWSQQTYFYTPKNDEKALKASQRRKRARNIQRYLSREKNPPVKR